MSRLYLLAAVVLAAALGIFIWTRVNAQVQAKTQAPPASGNQMTQNSPATDAAEYWTPERLRDAQPPTLTRPGAPEPNTVGQSVEPSQAAQTEQYWTPEQMQNAQPLPLTRPGSPRPAPPSEPPHPPTSGPSSDRQ